jgi:hypothetical protein
MARKFKFISPGVFLNEIDNSQLPSEPQAVGPLIIGNTRKGPAMRPVRVESFAEFVDVFGQPTAGNDGTDVWRSGEPQAPTYAAYAAQAWLKNSPTINVVRLLGTEHKNRTAATSNNSGQAGWRTDQTYAHGTTIKSGDDLGGAFGLWVFPPKISSSYRSIKLDDGESSGNAQATGSLAAIWYMKGGSIGLDGTNAAGTASISHAVSVLMQSDTSGRFKASIEDSDNGDSETIEFSIDSGDRNYLRRVFNTNPTLVNTNISSVTSSYWLGESFCDTIDIEASRNTAITGNYAASGHGSLTYINVSSSVAARAADTPKYLGIIFPIHAANSTAANYDHAHKLAAFADSSGNRRNSRTGWFISQNVGERTSFDAKNMQKLFRFHGLDNGTWCQNKFKISITNIRYSKNNDNKYGTFSIELRDIKDRDGAPLVLEKYDNCNLNPDSENYVARQVGDMYTVFDPTERILRERGNWPNRSKFIRIEMNTEVDVGSTNEEYLPWGVWGPPKYHDLSWHNHPQGQWSVSVATVASGNIWWDLGFKAGRDKTDTGARVAHGDHQRVAAFIVPGTADNSNVSISASFPLDATTGLDFQQLVSGTGDTSLSFGASSSLGFRFPSLPMRLSGTIGGTNFKTAYWGAYTGVARDKNYKTKHNEDIVDHLRVGASALVDAWDGDTTNAYLTPQFVFTMDDLSQSVGDGTATTAAAQRGGDFVYVSGSHQATDSWSSVDYGRAFTSQTSTSSIKDLIDEGVNKFTTLFHGGVDGLNITEQQPLRSGLLHNATATPTEKSSYVFNTYNEVIDTIKDSEVVECNLLSIPGLKHEPLTDKLVDVAESRGDTLAVIDLKKDFEPSFEGADASNIGKPVYRSNTKSVIDNLKDRQLNSSYGCAYYPWVKIRDTIGGSFVFIPPSIVAIGAMSYTDRVKAPWFAPAGFNRGGLSSGLAGLPVVGITQRLTSKDRDDLYDANINPIATFPQEGIVIFGQKTLQVTRSALDRINVRRLLIFVKKGISTISNELLFEQNVRETWERFINRANPFLNDVKARFGLNDYKLVLDETTTTPDLVDRNIMYAKIFLKPARSIEFIAVDFIITNTGAAFED